MTTRTGAAEIVLGFATGWPEDKPDLMMLSFSTHHGIRDFALSKEQALLVAKTIKETAGKLGASKK